MADQMQSDKNRQDTGKPVQLDKDKNRQDTGKPVQLDKEQQQGGQQQDKKPTGGQENRPSHQQSGADHQSGSKR
jgi:hypothetical protein